LQETTSFACRTKSAIMGVALPALIPLLVLLSIEVPIKDVLTKLLGILV
jgi:hypothetical protein